MGLDAAEEVASTPVRSWADVKAGLNTTPDERYFKEGSVWWVAVGENIGVEINGKSERYSRPVVILRKLSSRGFIGVPLTSKEHTESWYVPFEFQGRKEYACVHQIRSFSAKRLYGRLGVLSVEDLRKIRDGVLSLLDKGKSKE